MTYVPTLDQFKGNSCFVAGSVPEILSIVLAAPSVPFWARGEPTEYEIPCLPALYRPDHSFDDRTSTEHGSLTVGELAAIENCREDYRDGRITDELFSRFFDDGHLEDFRLEENDLLYWASLAQHHNIDQIYPTRLLDVTSDVLVATYFACLSHGEEDGYVFYGNFSHNNLLDNGTVTVEGSFFDIVEIEELGHPDDPYQPSDSTLCLAPLPFPNRRMTAQRGAFVWSRDGANGYFDQMRQFIIKIPNDSKPDFLMCLDRLGYNETNLIPPELPAASSIIR